MHATLHVPLFQNQLRMVCAREGTRKISDQLQPHVFAREATEEHKQPSYRLNETMSYKMRLPDY